MAAQLKNILNFVNIPVGGSQVLPHGLNNNFKKLVPDILTPGGNGGSATITATDTNVTVTNISADILSLEVLCEAWHTIERAFGPRQVTVLAPQPFVVGTSGGTQNAATQFVFVYRQGGIAGGNVYTDWATLMAAKSLVQGVKYLQIDSTIQIQGTTLLPATLTFGGVTVTYTSPPGAPAIPATVQGQYMTITGAANPGNNGSFLATFISATQISYTNAAGVTENPFLGVMTIYGGFTCVTPTSIGVTGPGTLNGKWDMTDTEVCGFHSPVAVGGAGGQLWQVGTGLAAGDVQFENWRKCGSEVAITFNNAVLPVNVIPVGGEIFEFGTGYTGDFPQLTNSGPALVWDCSALLAGQSFTFRVNGAVGNSAVGANPVIGFGASPGNLNLSLYGLGRLSTNMLTGGTAASVFQCGYDGGFISISEQPNWNGQFLNIPDQTRIVVTPQATLLNVAPLPATAPLVLAINQLAVYTAPGGTVVQPLPKIKPVGPVTGSTAINSVGIWIKIKNNPTAAGDVIVSAAAGDTIDGVAGPQNIHIAAGKMGTWWSDGFSNWIQELP